MIGISYEDLTCDTDKTLQRLCTFLDMPFTSDLMQFHESNEAKATASCGTLWENVTKPVMALAAKSWALAAKSWALAAKSWALAMPCPVRRVMGHIMVHHQWLWSELKDNVNMQSTCWWPVII